MKILPKLKDLSLLMPVALLCCIGCSSVEKYDSSTPEGAYKIAEEYEADERYEESVAKYSEVKNKHPYSRFAVMSELKIADVQFKREAFIEAQFAYQTFKDLHPKHPQIDYVTFRLGLSYFNQLPSTTDRDLSLADKAILYFDEVLTSYGQSSYAAEARAKKADALKMLAEKELYIANFYMMKKQYDSALGRFEGLLKTYSGTGVEPAALYGAAVAANASGEREKISRYVRTLLKQYPESSEADKARSEFSHVR
ncbi:MAG: outer membrane protein assembly factor BamD [Bdellovibrionales bacterium]|nr:outer membrane protein assembly factor BamD [Bdellovibrionales bacterium]